MTREMVARGYPPAWVCDGIAEDEIDVKQMADYARAGNADAKAFFDHIGCMLGRGIAQLVDVLNPECVVIGSIFVRCEDLLRPSMEQEIASEALVHSSRGLRILPAQTGESLGDLASIMAALYALDIDPMQSASERDSRVLAHYQRLFVRYPQLETCRSQVMDAYLLLKDCYLRGGKLLVCGNGGSCADSEHIVGELMKGFYLKRPFEGEMLEKLSRGMDELLPGAARKMQQGLPAIALTGHNPLSTAVQNDMDPLLAMAQQVVGYGRKGDVLIGISTSGNAKNVALAAQAASAMGMAVIGLTGGNGGRLKDMCDVTIVVPAATPADVQELHLPVYHTLCAMLEACFFS